MNENTLKSIKKIQEQFNDEYFETLVTYNKIVLIGENNNGYITTKEVSENNISREYIRILEKKGVIEKMCRGIYILKDVIPDDFYIFQLRYPKTIFSHSTALYFHNMTEEFPYVYDITCSRSYNVKTIKDNNIFYVDNNLLELGKIQIKTKYGNLINSYDIERTICDIIRSNNRIDEEQLIKTLKNIITTKKIKIDMHKLNDYSKKLRCHDKVINIIRYYDE